MSHGATFVNHGTVLLVEPEIGGDEFAPRIRARRHGEDVWRGNTLLAADYAVAMGGAGSPGGGAAGWAWEELSYDG